MWIGRQLKREAYQERGAAHANLGRFRQATCCGFFTKKSRDVPD